MSPVVSIVALAIVAAACVLGVFARSYKDNWAQFAGLVTLGIWCVARIDRLLIADAVGPESVMLHVGMMLFAVGTVYKQRRQIKQALDLQPTREAP